jgi:hypothetical protein
VANCDGVGEIALATCEVELPQLTAANATSARMATLRI